MRFNLIIHGNNDALAGPNAGREIARLLRDSADEIEEYGTGPGFDDDRAILLDANGNRVGEWALEAGSRP